MQERVHDKFLEFFPCHFSIFFSPPLMADQAPPPPTTPNYAKTNDEIVEEYRHGLLSEEETLKLTGLSPTALKYYTTRQLPEMRRFSSSTPARGEEGEEEDDQESPSSYHASKQPKAPPLRSALRDAPAPSSSATAGSFSYNNSAPLANAHPPQPAATTRSSHQQQPSVATMMMRPPEEDYMKPRTQPLPRKTNLLPTWCCTFSEDADKQDRRYGDSLFGCFTHPLSWCVRVVFSCGMSVKAKRALAALILTQCIFFFPPSSLLVALFPLPHHACKLV